VIPWPDLFRVRVQTEFDQLASYNPRVGGGSAPGVSLPGFSGASTGVHTQ
jgi:hypothetical protein